MELLLLSWRVHYEEDSGVRSQSLGKSRRLCCEGKAGRGGNGGMAKERHSHSCLHKRRREGLWGAEGDETERGSQENPAQRVLSYVVLILELSESITWSRQTPLLTFLFVFHSCL